MRTMTASSLAGLQLPSRMRRRRRSPYSAARPVSRREGRGSCRLLVVVFAHPHRLGEEVPNRAALPGRTWDPDLPTVVREQKDPTIPADGGIENDQLRHRFPGDQDSFPIDSFDIV